MNTQRPQGFTLMELMVYLGLSTVILLIMSQFMVDVSKNAARNRASLELQASARFITERIAQNVRSSATLDATAPTSLTVTLGNGDTYVYALSGTQLVETKTTVSGTTTETLTSDAVSVSSLNFTGREGGVGLTLVLATAATMVPAAPTHTIETTIIPRRLLYQ